MHVEVRMFRRVNFPVRIMFILWFDVSMRRGCWETDFSCFQKNSSFYSIFTHPFVQFYSSCLQIAHIIMESMLTHSAFQQDEYKRNMRISINGKEGWAILERTNIDFAAASSHRNIKSQSKHYPDRKVDPSELNMHLWCTLPLHRIM